MIAAELFKFNDCVEGEIKAVFVVSFLPKCVTGLSSGSSPALYTCLIQ